jgi:hypothetical protein
MKVSIGDNFGLGDALLCPKCNGDYLHHDNIAVFNRREDAEMVRKTAIEGGLVSVASVENKTSGNPSGRRDGLSIDFWCETCGDAESDEVIREYKRLHILQHKGNTFLRWEIIKN